MSEIFTISIYNHKKNKIKQTISFTDEKVAQSTLELLKQANNYKDCTFSIQSELPENRQKKHKQNQTNTTDIILDIGGACCCVINGCCETMWFIGQTCELLACCFSLFSPR